MKGQKNDQISFLHTFNPEEMIPAKHPIREIKQLADKALKKLEKSLKQLYSDQGRPSIPPETLLKANILMGLYSIRSERQLCEQLNYNLLFRWFLDIAPGDRVFDHSVFAKNRVRIIKHDAAAKFFYSVVDLARKQGYISEEHFTVDGTLIEGWASLKSFKRKDERPNSDDDNDGSGRNPDVNFHGEKRSNATHVSTTDPDTMLARKGPGKEAKLCHSGHVIMENRNGFCVDAEVSRATGTAERDAALIMLDRLRKQKYKPKTLGADKGYHTKGFVNSLRNRKISPHIAMITKRKTPGLDGRTRRSIGYQLSQWKRKKVEEIFGWAKTIGGLRKTRYKGTANVALHMTGCLTAYNLLLLATA